MHLRWLAVEAIALHLDDDLSHVLYGLVAEAETRYLALKVLECHGAGEVAVQLRAYRQAAQLLRVLDAQHVQQESVTLKPVLLMVAAERLNKNCHAFVSFCTYIMYT